MTASSRGRGREWQGPDPKWGRGGLDQRARLAGSGLTRSVVTTTRVRTIFVSNRHQGARLLRLASSFTALA